MTLIRFQQRRENFNKSFDFLQKTLAIPNLSDIERAGLIQFFEITFELAWKCLGDYLESEGFTLESPKKILRQAFQSKLIDDAEKWLQALEDRNLTTHTYDEKKSKEVEQMIRSNYALLIQKLHSTLATL